MSTLAETTLSPVPSIAAAWGTSRTYVYACRKKGCPVTLSEGQSIEDLILKATEWRDANSPRGVGYRTKDAAPDVKSIKQEYEEKSLANYEEQQKRMQKERSSRIDVSTIEGSLKQAIRIERHCAEEVERLSGMPGKLLTAINAYNKAQSNRMDTEKRVMQIQKEKGTLITHDAARGIINRVWGPFLSRLRACPRNAAILANPQNDILAEAAIRKEIELAIAEGQKGYATA